MRDKNSKEVANGSSDKRRLRLVDRPAEQQKESRISEPAASELRELIVEVRQRVPRKKKIEDDLLPPAA